ncbi:hypothetical protein RDABS01_014850 [Bienertia sinuspersici]
MKGRMTGEKLESPMKSPTNEENDQLKRSNKKAKRNINHLIFNNQNNNDVHATPMEEDLEIQDSGNKSPKEHNISVSFKHMVQGSSSKVTDLGMNRNVNPLFDNESCEDLDSDDDQPPGENFDVSKCSIILLTKEEKKRIRSPWKTSLIIKTFDKNVGYITLMRRLIKKWNLKDYNHVLTEGPWLINDHYLTIRTWVPDFVLDNKPIKFLTAWVRIPNLAVEYFDTIFLHRIGEKIGRVIKVDKITQAATRGQFTRLCVELDWSKPLLLKFWLKGKNWKIQYEGLRLICYHCGKINHKEEECPLLKAQEKDTDHEQKEDSHVQEIHPEEAENIGSWILVRKPTRTRGPAKSKKPQKP